MLGDLWRFALAVRRHWKGLVTGSLGLAGLGWLNTIVTRHTTTKGATTKVSFVPSWMFVAAIVLLLLFGFFLAWRDEHAARLNAERDLATALTAPPPDAPEAHIAQLRETAAAMSKSIRGGLSTGHTDRRTRSLFAHLPELEKPLIGWDNAVRADLEARKAFRKRVEVEVAVLSDPPFVKEPLVGAIAEYAVRDVHDVSKDWSMPLIRDPFDESGSLQLPARQGTVVSIAADDQEQQAHFDAVQAVFRAAYRSPELEAVRRADDGKAAAMADAVELFDSVQDRFDFSLLHVCADCDLCGKGR
jgi:hypothetical protein